MGGIIEKPTAHVHLRARQDLVWNATNIIRTMRSQLISLFADYSARIRIVYVEQLYHTWRTQNADREYAVPIGVLNNLLVKLEVPGLGEAHEVVYHVH